MEINETAYAHFTKSLSIASMIALRPPHNLTNFIVTIDMVKIWSRDPVLQRAYYQGRSLCYQPKPKVDADNNLPAYNFHLNTTQAKITISLGI